MSPHATKRMIADVAGAASESFAGSTGDTKQDIVNAITAAAGASGKQRATYDDAMKLAIGESIQKGIAKATYKPNTTETLIALANSTKKKDQETFQKLTKGSDVASTMIIDLSKNYVGDANAIGKATGDYYKLKATSADAPDYGGTLPTTYNNKTKTNEEDFTKMVIGKIYFNSLDGNFYVTEKEKEGPKLVNKPDYLK
jgi:hypothetical protein